MKKYLLVFLILLLFPYMSYGQSNYFKGYGSMNLSFGKTPGTASSLILYDDYLSELIGAGWMGPHATSTMTNSYYLQLPLAQPTLGQVLQAGTPATNISTMSWILPALSPAGYQVSFTGPTAARSYAIIDAAATIVTAAIPPAIGTATPNTGAFTSVATAKETTSPIA